MSNSARKSIRRSFEKKEKKLKLYLKILRRDKIRLMRKDNVNIGVFYILKFRSLFYSVGPTRLVYVINSTLLVQFV